MRRLMLLLAAFAVLLLAGCGGHAKTITPAPVKPAASCPPGRSFMGCASGAQAKASAALPPGRAGVTKPVPGCKFPDTSDWQGHPNWAAAAGSICAGVAKAGEGFSEDPDFAYSVAQLRQLHIPWSGYWFIRSCSEAPAFNTVLSAIGFRGDRDALRPVLDMEVPAASGCAVPLANSIHAAFGVWPIIYTSPGTWPGGSAGGLDTWEADFGSSLAPLPYASRVLAWQAWSPPYRYLYIPGLGYGDVSVDLHGFSTALAFPKPVHHGPSIKRIQGWIRQRNSALAFYHANKCAQPIFTGVYCTHFASQVVKFQARLPGKHVKCWGRGAKLSAPICQIVRPEAYFQNRAATASYAAFQAHGCLGPSGQVAHGGPVCGPLLQRAEYFTRKAHATYEAWS